MNRLIEKSLIIIGLFFVFIITSYTAFQPVRTDDTFWHLRIGQIISSERTLPVVERVLYTSGDIKPMYHEWLFQVIISFFDKVFGIYSLRFFTLFMYFLILWVIWSLSGLFLKFKYILRILILTGFTVFAYQRIIQLRPELFSIFFFYLLLYIILTLKNSYFYLKMFGVFFISLIWANIHSLAPLIYLFWGLNILSLIFCSYVYKFNSYEINLKQNIIAFMISFSGMLINPMGFKLFYFYFKGNSINPYKNVIDEWGTFDFNLSADFLPLSSPVAVIGYFVICIFVSYYFVGKICRMKNNRDYEIQNITSNKEEPHLIVNLLFISLSALAAIFIIRYAVRFVWLIPIPLIFIFSQNIFKQKTILKSILGLFIVLCSVIHFILPGTVIYHFPIINKKLMQDYFVWPYDKVKYCNDAVSFLKQEKIKGRIYNPYYMGGFLGYNLYPDVKIFIDGRFEHYTEEVNRDYYLIMNPSTDFFDLLKKYKIEIFFVPKEPEWEKLLSFLIHAKFKRIYSDNLAEIFVVP